MQPRVSSVRFGRTARRSQSSSPPSGYKTPLKSDRLSGRISWPLSISLFAVPVVLALFTFLVPRLLANPEVAIRVTDRYTGQQISGATLVIGETELSTGPDGMVTVVLGTESSPATIQAPGYEGITTTLSRGGSTDWQVALR